MSSLWLIFRYLQSSSPPHLSHLPLVGSRVRYSGQPGFWKSVLKSPRPRPQDRSSLHSPSSLQLLYLHLRTASVGRHNHAPMFVLVPSPEFTSWEFSTSVHPSSPWFKLQVTKGRPEKAGVNPGRTTQLGKSKEVNSGLSCTKAWEWELYGGGLWFSFMELLPVRWLFLC